MFYRLKGNLMRVIRDDINIYPFSSLRLLLPHMAWHGRQNNANCFSTKIPAVAKRALLLTGSSTDIAKSMTVTTTN